MSFFVDPFVTDLAATVIRATGHQMVSLCRSVRLCGGESTTDVCLDE